MKKCEHIKELILTDYLDGQLDKNSAESLESHLLGCSDCRAFLKEVKNNAVLPLGQALRQPVPAELWDAIDQSIDREDQGISHLEKLIDRLKGMVVFPRLVPVFASLILMLVVGSITVNTIQVQRTQEKEQGEYLVSLLSSTDTAVSDTNEGGSPLEHYFL